MIFELRNSSIDGEIAIVPVGAIDAWDMFYMLDACFNGLFFVSCFAGYENAVQYRT